MPLGASTELTPEYTELMEQIDEIIKSQNEAGGEDLITDVQLFGKNVLLSLKDYVYNVNKLQEIYQKL